MNKFRILALTVSIYLLSSCKLEPYKDKEINLIVNDFNMSQLSTLGEKLYIIKSPKSKFNKNSQVYLLDKTKITFFDKKEIAYTVDSNEAQLLNHKIIKLNGDIQIVDVSDEKNIINADSFYWDIKDENFILEGNVRLNNKNIDLMSSKAFLNKNTNIIKFFKPVKYNYKNSMNKSTYKLSSESAFYNLLDKKLIFESESEKERVRSKIYF